MTVLNDPFILVRAVHFAATLVASGTVAFLVLVAARDLPPALRRRLALMSLGALALAVLSGAAWLVLFASDVFGVPVVDASLYGEAWSVLTETRFGQVSSVRLLLGGVLAVLVLRTTMPIPLLATAALFAALPAWTGHAGAGLGTAGAVQVAADAIHLVAAAAWLGGLPALAIMLSATRRSGTPAPARIVARFSLLGMISVASLLASGLVNSWSLLGSPFNLTTTYGRLLLLKLGLFLAMVAIAAVNRFRLTARLPDGAAVSTLARNSLAETALGLGIVLLVGALGTLPPSGHAHVGSPSVPRDAAFVHIHTAPVMADLTIEPGRATQVRAAIRLLREDGSEFAARFVRIEMEAPAGAQILQADGQRRPDGSWVVPELKLATPGAWIAKVIVSAEDGRDLVLDAPVLIEP